MKMYTDTRACVDNERGSALIVTLLMFCIIFVMGLTLLGSAATNVQMSETDRDYQSVFYIAESGRDYEVEALNSVVEEKCENTADADSFFTAMNMFFSDTNNFPKTIELFDSQFGETVTATVNVEGMAEWTSGVEEHTYTIVSEGHIGGIKRKVASDITFSYVEGTSDAGSPIDVGVFSLSTITLLDGTCVDGPVGANTSENGGIYLDWNSDVGDVMISPDADPEDVFELNEWDDLDSHIDDIIVMQEEREYPLPDYPDPPSLTYRGNLILAADAAATIDEDGVYNEIKVQDSALLTIDVGNDERQIVVDDLTINGDGTVRIIGSGTLLLHVNNSFVLAEGGEFNNDGDDDQAMIYYGGSETFNPTGGVPLFANMYVKEADISLGTGVMITGNIISGGDDVLISGGLEAYVRVIYAPNALVNIIGGGHVNGAIVAQQFQMEGGGNVTYNAAVSIGDIPGVSFGSNSPPQVDLDVDKAVERDY